MTPTAKLIQAIENNSVTAIRAAMSAGATIQAVNFDGLSLLEVAQKRGALQAARFLLEQGSNPNVTTASGETLLHRAARQGDFGFVTLLLEHGADPESLDHKKRRPVDVARPKDGYVANYLQSKSKVRQPMLF